jgi:hypothetical protein
VCSSVGECVSVSVRICVFICVRLFLSECARVSAFMCTCVFECEFEWVCVLLH